MEQQQDKHKGQMFELHDGKKNENNYEGETSNNEQTSSSVTSFPAAPPPSRNTTSKYDFVKVRVWLGENADHYYVLSRFLLSRMLTVTKIPNHVAIKIALELKKLLVDNSLLDVSQSDLEANLFKLMERRGYGEEYINRYKMMTRFHHQRVPFVILVCGTACVGKSTIATQLAQRLNLPNVLQTDMVYELLRTSTDAPLASTPVWAREFRSSEELVTEFCRECRIVRKGLAGDLKKAMKDGKPIIIEGIHLDPSIYLMDEENRESNGQNATTEHTCSSDQNSLEHNIEEKNEQSSKEVLNEDVSLSCGSGVAREVDKKACKLEITVPNGPAMNETNVDLKECQESAKMPGKTSTGTHGSKVENVVKSEKLAAKPIIVPIVLKMADFDHKALLEEWVSTRTNGGKCPRKDQERLLNNLKTIQDYLCSFESQGMTVVNISATTFPQTLDWLHNHLLQCIERGCSTNTEAGS
uniref:2-phosphoglycerate kinase n=1 Tax=Araucaria cunninghamii TaxID=56994 RepID=A0A0D6R5I0_ARACU